MSVLNILAKAVVILSSIAVLVASGVQTGGGFPIANEYTQASLFRDGANASASLKESQITFIDLGDGEHSLSSGKEYVFGADDLVKDETQLYHKKFDGIDAYFQNSSKRNFETGQNLTTPDVSLWYFGLDDLTANTRNASYSVVGTPVESLPSAKITSYKGRVEGYSVNNTSNDHYWIDGDINLQADFNIGKQSINGKIDNIKTYDQQNNNQVVNSTREISIKSANITANGFDASLGETKNSTEQNVVSSSLQGNFYGNGATQVGGTGLLETDDFRTAFGFTALN